MQFRIHRSFTVLILILVGLAPPTILAQDQMVFQNGDVVHGKFLNRTESLIYFESVNFGVLKVPSLGVELIIGSEEPLGPGADDTADGGSSEAKGIQDSFPDEIEEPTSQNQIDKFWESAELTLEKIVNDKVPAWFPVLPDGWIGSLRMGIDVNEAATNTNRYSGEVNLEGNFGNYNLLVDTYVTYSETAGTASEDDWGLTARGRYFLRSKDFIEIQGIYQEDDLNDPRERLIGSLGFGISPRIHESITLDLVGGGALQRDVFRGEVPNRSFNLNFNENFSWRFNEHLTLKQRLQLFVVPEETLDYLVRFSVNLDTLILGSFVLGVGYKLDYNTEISDPDLRLRTRFTTSLGINF
jgi:hypothetical protein